MSPTWAGDIDAWDIPSVERYLDARMTQWWEKAKPLKTGQAQVRCISCHTAIPYVMARSALRKASGAAELTEHEVRIVDGVRSRIVYDQADQPYYDQNEDKKLESAGVEAVINAFVVTQYATDARAMIDSSHVRAAMTRLWQVQRSDGAWNWLNFGLEPYEAPDAVYQGATVAALAAGSIAGLKASKTAAGRAGLERLRGYLSDNYAAQRLFNKTWALLASSQLEGVMTQGTKASLVATLRSVQRADGGWSLADLGPWRWSRQEGPFAPPGTVDAALVANSDGYATGLVVYALRRSGLSAADPTVAKGQAWLRSHQTEERTNDLAWAPWRTYSLNHDRENGGGRGEAWRRMFMSDLATGFAAMGLMPLD